MLPKHARPPARMIPIRAHSASHSSIEWVVKTTLRPSERLEFTQSKGELRSITAKPGEESFQLQAHAVVEGMSSGSGNVRRNRMPNWVEWGYGKEWLVRLVTGLIPGVGLVYSILKWFRVVG